MAGSDGASAVAEIRGLLVEFDSRRDPGLLTAALERAETVLAAPGFAQLSGAVRAFVLTLAAGAATWRARTSEGRPEDLDHAISWTEQAIDAWPPEDPNRPRTQVNLATALVDRYESDGDRDDLNRAVTVLEAAIPVMRAGGDRVDTALHSLGNAYHDRASAEPRGAREDLDHAIALFREALDSPEPTSGERAGYLNSLGLSLRARGAASGDPALLREADETYRAARELAEPDGDTFAAATSNLAAVLQDRAEAENDEGLLREAVQLYRDVLPALDGQRRTQATTNLATALIDLYRYSRDRDALDEATRGLRRSAAAFPIGPRRQVALANLAAALHEIYDHTGRIATLDEAIAVQDELLAPPSPRPPERTLNLGVSLLARFRRRRVLDDLDRAIELFAEAALAAASPTERASAMNSQANGLSLRFDATGARADLDHCLDLRERAIATAPPGSLAAALYRANLGVDLLKRYEIGEDGRDLERAIIEQRRAVREAPATSAEQPRLLAGLADSLAQAAGSDTGPDIVAEVRRTYRKVVVDGRESLPEQALGAALRWAAWETTRQSWPQASAVYELGLAATIQLFGRQERRADRESWLGDALGLPSAAAYAHVRAGDPTRAVAALEHGRAMLLADALRRRRLTTHAPP